MGSALDLSGGGHVTVAGSEALEFGTADYSIAAWINAIGAGSILAKAPPRGVWAPQAKVFFVRGRSLHFDSGWVGVVKSGMPVTDGTWHHVAMSFEDATNTVTLYADGAECARRPLGLKKDPSGFVVKIGFASPDFPNPTQWPGFIDDLRVYDRVLAPEEIAKLAGKPLPPGGMR
jgi:hypothetical protein